VLAPDVPGFGDSPPVGSGFVLEQVADALAGALERRAARLDLLGHSLGGAIAVVLAERHPALVRRLVLSAPAGFAPRPALLSEALGLGALAFLPARRTLGRALRHNAPARRLLLFGTVADGARLSPDDALGLFEASRHAHRLRPAIAAAARAELAERLAGLRVPVGLLWGRADRVIPFGVSERVRAALGDPPFETLDGVGHVPQVECPDRFVEALERLLDRLPTA